MSVNSRGAVWHGKSDVLMLPPNHNIYIIKLYRYIIIYIYIYIFIYIYLDHEETSE